MYIYLIFDISSVEMSMLPKHTSNIRPNNTCKINPPDSGRPILDKERKLI